MNVLGLTHTTVIALDVCFKVKYSYRVRVKFVERSMRSCLE